MSDTFRLKIISPKGVYIEEDIEMLETVSTEGEMGIYKGHVPTAIILTAGITKIHTKGEIKKIMISGGFAEILEDKVTMMAEQIITKEEIDINRAKESLSRAQNRLNNPSEDIDIKRAELSMKRALMRIKLAEE